ncbi:DUF4974 domain-containing protein [Bacteroidaceae bacterium HV4-6-C5C]|jgi:Fe2+-dicitrate sensor, membrane component|nr:DUF4974 domain-containing protein [Bacteroidaceae bacterium HV4-6-C5C]
MKDNSDKYNILIEKLFTKRATIDEIRALSHWIASYDNHKEFDSYCEKAWENCIKEPNQIIEKEIWSNLKDTIKKEEKQKLHYRLPISLYKIAISILIPICIGLSSYIIINMYEDSTNVPFEAVVDYGQKANLTLPDGTKVWLNSGSKLSYDNAYNKKERAICLNGEAYFEVAKNPNRKFIVSCNGLKVEALGTIFNVKGYQEDHYVTAALLEGRIKVYRNNQETILIPNEALEYNKLSGNFTKQKIADMREIDFWRRNMLYFRSATLESISKTLERTYGITIKFESKELKNITFSGSIRNNSLANVFHIISLTYPLSYKTNKDTVIISKE